MTEAHAGGAESPNIDWRIVVEQIRAGDPAGEETLYRELTVGARFFLQRRLGFSDVEDRVHDVFVIVVQAIRTGSLREPERLMGFVRTVLYRQLNLAIGEKIDARTRVEIADSASKLRSPEAGPEQAALEAERVEFMEQAMRRLKPADIEILKRFYMRGQDRDTICREMSLSPNQVSVRKTRAKAFLAEFVRRRSAKRLSQ